MSKTRQHTPLLLVHGCTLNYDIVTTSESLGYSTPVVFCRMHFWFYIFIYMYHWLATLDFTGRLRRYISWLQTKHPRQKCSSRFFFWAQWKQIEPIENGGKRFGGCIKNGHKRGWPVADCVLIIGLTKHLTQKVRSISRWKNAVSKYTRSSSWWWCSSPRYSKHQIQELCAYLFAKRWPYYAEVIEWSSNGFRKILILASLVLFHSLSSFLGFVQWSNWKTT